MIHHVFDFVKSFSQKNPLLVKFGAIHTKLAQANLLIGHFAYRESRIFISLPRRGYFSKGIDGTAPICYNKSVKKAMKGSTIK